MHSVAGMTGTGLVSAAYRHSAAMAALRRQLGSSPPRERPPRARVLDEVRDLDAAVAGQSDLSSVVVVIHGRRPGGVVMLRSNVDQRDTATTGAVHAAALVGAARILGERRDQITGSVVLVWQPGAGDGGARQLLDDGVLNAAGRPVDAVYGVATLPGLPHGVIATRTGLIIAAADQLQVAIRTAASTGGARPVSVACHLAGALDLIAMPGVALTVNQVTARASDAATVTATVRTRHTTTQDQVIQTVTRMARAYATAHGMTATVQITPATPAAVNHHAEAAWVTQTVAEVYGRERLVQLGAPVALADDIGVLLDAVPGALALVLGAIPDPDPDHDTTLLPTTAALLAGVALRRLAARRVTITRHQPARPARPALTVVPAS